jgi:hypothetical protein
MIGGSYSYSNGSAFGLIIGESDDEYFMHSLTPLTACKIELVPEVILDCRHILMIKKRECLRPIYVENKLYFQQNVLTYRIGMTHIYCISNVYTKECVDNVLTPITKKNP